MKSRKITGVIIAVALVIVALVAYGVSQIKITPKQPVSTSQVSQTAETQRTKSDAKALLKVKNESLLDYSGADIVVNGTVSEKECYLNETQVVYVLTLKTATGTEMDYFCSYTVYASVNVGDAVNITYKNLTESAYAIMSVTKE